MTSHRELISNWQSQIARAAHSINIQWPDIIEEEDLVQEINLRLLETPGSVEVLADMEEGVRYRALVEIGHQIASKKRDENDIFNGNFRYSVGEVEGLMKQVGLYWQGRTESPFSVPELSAAWNAGDVVTSGRGVHADPVANVALESIKRESVRKDLLTALDKLNRRYLDILVRKFVDKEKGFDTAERKRLERALIELTNEMNHSRKSQHAGKLVPGKSLGDGPGTRKAISNSTARYLSKENWDADYMPAPLYLRDNATEKEVWDL